MRKTALNWTGKLYNSIGGYLERAGYEAQWNGKFQSMLDYAHKRMQENSNPNRKKYDLISNSCNHFMKGVLDAAGVDTPYMFDPRPNSYIAEIRLDYPKLDYSRAEHKLVVENPPASLASIIRVYAQPAAA